LFLVEITMGTGLWQARCQQNSIILVLNWLFFLDKTSSRIFSPISLGYSIIFEVKIEGVLDDVVEKDVSEEFLFDMKRT